MEDMKALLEEVRSLRAEVRSLRTSSVTVNVNDVQAAEARRREALAYQSAKAEVTCRLVRIPDEFRNPWSPMYMDPHHL